MEATNKDIYTHSFDGVHLTRRQHEVLMFIREFRSNHGMGPTLREMMESKGCSSPNAIMCHLRVLRSRGLISWNPGKARSVRLVGFVAVDVPAVLLSEVQALISKRMKELKCEK